MPSKYEKYLQQAVDKFAGSSHHLLISSHLYSNDVARLGKSSERLVYRVIHLCFEAFTTSDTQL